MSRGVFAGAVCHRDVSRGAVALLRMQVHSLDAVRSHLLRNDHSRVVHQLLLSGVRQGSQEKKGERPVAQGNGADSVTVGASWNTHSVANGWECLVYEIPSLVIFTQNFQVSRPKDGFSPVCTVMPLTGCVCVFLRVFGCWKLINVSLCTRQTK